MKEMITMQKQWKGYQEKRRGPDFWSRLLQIAPLLAWPLVFLILIVIDHAKPESYTFLDRVLHVPRRSYWDLHILKNAFYTSLLLLIFSIFGLVVNRFRHRRKTDRYSTSLIISMMFSLLIIVFYFLKVF